MTQMTQDTSHASLRTRPAAPADLPRLVRIINAAYSIESFLDGTRTDLEHLTASLQTGTILVLEEADGNPLASVYAEVRGERGYLGLLAVDPAHQGRGLARLVVEAAAEHLRRQGCRALDISVLSLRTELLPSIAASALSKPALRSSITPAPSATAPAAIAS